MLTELSTVLSFTIAELFRNCTWNSEWICVCVCVCVCGGGGGGEGGGGMMSKERGNKK